MKTLSNIGESLAAQVLDRIAEAVYRPGGIAKFKADVKKSIEDKERIAAKEAENKRREEEKKKQEDLKRKKEEARREKEEAIARYGGPLPKHGDKKAEEWKTITKYDMIEPSKKVTAHWKSLGFNFACDMENPHLPDRMNRDLITVEVVTRMMMLAAESKSNTEWMEEAFIEFDDTHPETVKREQLLGRHAGIDDYVKRIPFKVFSRSLNFPLGGFVKYRLPKWCSDEHLDGTLVVGSTPLGRDPNYFPDYPDEVQMVVESLEDFS